MKSGLEGRNNLWMGVCVRSGMRVSMKSGLEGRNNSAVPRVGIWRRYESQ